MSKENLDLTDDEIKRILFGSEDGDISKSNNKTIDKNIKKKIIDIRDLSLTKKAPKKLKKVKSPTNQEKEKRPHGRPRIWTPEKIEAEKEKKKLEARLRQQQREEKRRLARLSINEPIPSCEVDRRKAIVIKRQEEIEQELLEKRNHLKKSIGRKFVVILDKDKKCNNHIYKFSHFNYQTNNYVCVCKTCSKIQEFAPYQWTTYKNKTEE